MNRARGVDRPQTSPTRYLPKPPAYTCKPEQFFDYWTSLKPEDLEICIVYVYRAWPVINRLMVDSTAVKNIAKLTVPFEKGEKGTAWWIQEILHRWGCGTYKFNLNAAGMGKSVCITMVETERDFTQYPPLIEDGELVLDDPSNRSYVQFLRVRNLLPDPEAAAKIAAIKQQEQQQKREEEEEEMKDQLVGTLIEQVGKQQEQTISILKENAKAATAAPATAAPVVVQQGITPEVLGHTMQTLNTSWAKQVESHSPLEVMKQLKDFLPQQDNSMIAVLMKQNADMMDRALKLEQERADRLEARLEEYAQRELQRQQLQLAGNGQPNGQAQQVNTNNPLEFIKQLRDYKEILDDTFGGGRGAPAMDGDEIPSKGNGTMFATVMQYVGPAIPYITSIVANYMAQRVGAPPMPAPPMMAPDGMQQAMQQHHASPVDPHGMTGQAQAPAAPQMNPGDPMFALYQNQTEIKQTLLQYLTSGKDGLDFADWFRQRFNETLYQNVRSFGVQAIANFLVSGDAALAQVANQNPQPFVEFLTEFCTADEIDARMVQEEEAAKAAELQSQQPPRNPRAVIRAVPKTPKLPDPA